MPHSGNGCQADLWTGIGNNEMDGVGLMEGLINSIKPLNFAVASITIKVRIPYKCFIHSSAENQAAIIVFVLYERRI